MTVARANQTITFPTMEDQFESNVSMALPAFASSGLTITYDSSDMSIVSISGGSAIFHQPGTVTITASQPGDSNYNPAPDETGSLTVLEEVQVILFLAKGEPGSVLRDFVLTPLAFQMPLDSIPGGSSGNPVEVSVTGGTAASGVHTETMTLHGLRYLDVYSTSSGTVLFTATQDGGTNNGLEYAAATPVSQEIVILEPSLENYRLAMREHPDYDSMYADFSVQYVGQINPDTGYLYTPSEIQGLFEGDSTDLDKDGVPNLLEYAYGTDSLSHNIRERKVFPKMKPLVRTGGGLKKARYQFYRRTASSDPNLSYVVQTTTDMYNWTTSGITEVSAEYTDGEMEIVTVEFDQAYNDPGAPKFLIVRLNITSSE